MVDDRGQLYTIEGVAAGILMVVTAYLVISSTTVLTPQDVHIVDMQLEQLGSDALAILDTPDSFVQNPNETANKSMLQRQIENDGGIAFGENFSRVLNSKVNPSEADSLKFNATIHYRDVFSGVVKTKQLNESAKYYRENAVKVNRWVLVNPVNPNNNPFGLDGRNQTVLVEVLLWRG